MRIIVNESECTVGSTSKPITFFTTGGTIDKIYFDDLSEFAVGHSMLECLLQQAHVGLEYSIKMLMKKDSLEINAADRDLISAAVLNTQDERIVITHGTDTMAVTAERLREHAANKCIVLCGSMQPARMRESDAAFNVGAALMAVQTLPYGVYIAMSGQVFEAGKVKKNRDKQCFEKS